jgi:nitroreductase
MPLQSAYVSQPPLGGAVDLPASLLAVLEAARLAPSPHNTQPWRMAVTGTRDIRLDWDRARVLSVADSEGATMCYALGCAIEAMTRVAHVAFDPQGDGSPQDPGWHAGTLRVGSLKDDSAQAETLIRRRGTTRTSYPTERIPRDVLQDLQREAAEQDAVLCVLESPQELSRFAELTQSAAATLLADDAYLMELLRWTRLTPDEESASLDGLTPQTLALDAKSARLMRILRSRPQLRAAGRRLGLPRVMATQLSGTIPHSGALLLLARRVADTQDRIAGGRAMMAVWLAATRAELAVQPAYSVLGVPTTQAATVELFEAPPETEVISILRIGRATDAPPRSRRLPLDAICTGAQ